MKERPILFSGPMVNAIFDGRKTQTRRVVKPQPEQRGTTAGPIYDQLVWKGHALSESGKLADMSSHSPYGQPGDRLWVRETFRYGWSREEKFYNDADGASRSERAWERCDEPTEDRVWYDADGAPGECPYDEWAELKTPSIYMPRWACRLGLTVTDVRVERLQEISAADVLAEGVGPCGEADNRTWLRKSFHDLWDSINKKRGFGWDVNPWVWTITFERIKS